MYFQILHMPIAFSTISISQCLESDMQYNEEKLGFWCNTLQMCFFPLLWFQCTAAVSSVHSSCVVLCFPRIPLFRSCNRLASVRQKMVKITHHIALTDINAVSAKTVENHLALCYLYFLILKHRTLVILVNDGFIEKCPKTCVCTWLLHRQVQCNYSILYLHSEILCKSLTL